MKIRLESKINFFCTCQDYIIDIEKVDDILNTYFKDCRMISDEIDKDDFIMYASPRIQGKIKMDDYNIEYFSHFFPSYESLNSIIKDALQDEPDDYVDSVIEHVKKEIDEYINNTEFNHDYSIDQVKISVRITTKKENLNVTALKKIWKNDEILKIATFIKDYNLVSYEGLVCPHLHLEEKYKIIGNIVPRPLPLPIEVEEHVGKTAINGIKLDFQRSPIGLYEIYITKIKEGLEFRIKSNLIISNFGETPNDVFNYSNNILTFFVEEGE